MILDFIAANGAMLKEIVADGSVVVLTASAICAMTKTPDPSTFAGKAYRVIEAAALLIGNAKDKGFVPDNPVADKIGMAVVEAVRPAVTAAVVVSSPSPSPTSIAAPAAVLMLAIAAFGLQACAPSQVQTVQAKVVSFEQTAAPIVAGACTQFRAAEMNPLVQMAVAGGTMAANAATGGVAGSVVASVKSFGDAFCQAGPPSGDSTTAAQQAQWLNQQVTAQLLALVGAPKP